MPKLLDLELSGRSLAFRVVLGVISAALTFLIFFYVPANLTTLISGYIPADMRTTINTLLASLIGPAMPPLGILLAALAFLSSLLHGSKVYGLILLVEGLCFIAYLYLAFQGGTLSITLPKELLYGISANLQINLANIMFLFMIPSLLGIIKGIILALKKD